ncbi:unnamed protein product [Urochloa humidicola]
MPGFRDARWVNGAWDLRKFEKGGVVDKDAVIETVQAEQVLYLLNEIQGSYQEEAVEHHQHCSEDSPQEEAVHLDGCTGQIVNCMDVLK